jgi:hypothetical protein
VKEDEGIPANQGWPPHFTRVDEPSGQVQVGPVAHVVADEECHRLALGERQYLLSLGHVGGDRFFDKGVLASFHAGAGERQVEGDWHRHHHRVDVRAVK